jgi:hypothetical protein
VFDAQYVMVAAVVVVLMVAASWLLRRSRGRGGPMIVQTRAMPPTKGSLDASASRRVTVELGREILQLLEEGRREEAVALVRETTGWGAREAGEVVVKLESLKKRLEW